MAKNNHCVVITPEYEMNAMKTLSNARKSIADTIRKNFSKGDDNCLSQFKASLERENPQGHECNVLIDYIISEYNIWRTSYTFDENYFIALKLYQKSIKHIKNRNCKCVKNIVNNDLKQLKTFLLRHVALEEFGCRCSYWRTLEEKLIDICCVLESPSEKTLLRIYGLNKMEDLKQEIAEDFISLSEHLKLTKKVYDLSSQLNEDKMNCQMNSSKKTDYTNKELAVEIMNNLLNVEYSSKEGCKSINKLFKIFNTINQNFVCIKEHLPYLKVFPYALTVSL
jgi:hypothetical protein